MGLKQHGCHSPGCHQQQQMSSTPPCAARAASTASLPVRSPCPIHAPLPPLLPLLSLCRLMSVQGRVIAVRSYPCQCLSS